MALTLLRGIAWVSTFLPAKTYKTGGHPKYIHDKNLLRPTSSNNHAAHPAGMQFPHAVWRSMAERTTENPTASPSTHHASH